MQYQDSAGNVISRDDAAARIDEGRTVTVANKKDSMTIAKGPEYIVSACKKHNAKCEMKTPGRALDWVQDHLRLHHS